jgi:hypothetical protein
MQVWAAAIVACSAAAMMSNTTAQDVEPRAYSNAPIGYDLLVTGLAATRGGTRSHAVAGQKSPADRAGDKAATAWRSNTGVGY